MHSSREGGGAIAHETHFLPRVPISPRNRTNHHSDDNRSLKGKVDSSADEKQTKKSERPSALHAPGNLETLTHQLRERDIEILKLRHENALLKQIERRQQKDLEALEWQSDEQVVRALRDEINGLKNKLKLYFTQLSSNVRELRHLSEDRQRLKDQNSRLEKLATDKQLADREHLQHEVDVLSVRLNELNRVSEEAVKRAELIEKNMNIDNRHLRGRAHHLERENVEFRERAQKLEDALKERDKAIASLEIHRYNAVHRKPEPVICKNCLAKDQEITELHRIATIQGKLPILRTPQVLKKMSKHLELSYSLPVPSKNEDEGPRYTRATLSYSKHVNMQRDVTRINLEIPKAGQQNDGGDEHGGQGGHEKGGKAGASRTKHQDQHLPSEVVRTLKIEGLQPSTTYYIHMSVGYEDLNGPPTAVAKASTVAIGEDIDPPPGQLKREISLLAGPPETLPVPNKPILELVTRDTVRVVTNVQEDEQLSINLWRLFAEVDQSILPTSTSSDAEAAPPKLFAEALGKLESGKIQHRDLLPIEIKSGDSFAYTVTGLHPTVAYRFRLQYRCGDKWSESSVLSDEIRIEPGQRQPTTPSITEPEPSTSNAAAIALPPSPLPPDPSPIPQPQEQAPPKEQMFLPPPAETPAEERQADDREGPPPGKLMKASSKTGSNLTLNQRVENMHHGMPAYHEPPIGVKT
ncbi:uncharacterized protein EV422DRAFT_419052 [Fimicolochytrium jonesii]|uniref:uncharacterized protein n=1 Tax=Fimicolochytrium jonesii TaxID=1396493 RepID=UPI0022FE7042|nr:uncharacterized protein EV422DRAFT_419052 [Fimicolochytrium jonesii]KAI8822155.1 hypothetical protein EV422DRAFT_419052 [Fimicolochytrium jonesii]